MQNDNNKYHVRFAKEVGCTCEVMKSIDAQYTILEQEHASKVAKLNESFGMVRDRRDDLVRNLKQKVSNHVEKIKKLEVLKGKAVEYSDVVPSVYAQIERQIDIAKDENTDDFLTLRMMEDEGLIGGETFSHCEKKPSGTTKVDTGVLPCRCDPCECNRRKCSQSKCNQSTFNPVRTSHHHSDQANHIPLNIPIAGVCGNVDSTDNCVLDIDENILRNILGLVALVNNPNATA